MILSNYDKNVIYILFPIIDIQSCCATLGDGLYDGLDWLKSSVENKAVKESIMKPVNETSEAIQKPYNSLSSMFSSISSYFSSAQ